MNGQQNMEDRLWDYIDGSCNAAEQSFIEELLATQEDWRMKYHELLEVHQLMQHSLELDEPSMRFTQNVMEEIARFRIAPAAKTYFNKKIIYGLAGFFIAMIVGIFVYGLGQVNWSDNSSSGNNDILNNFDPGKIQWGKFLNNTYTNIVLMVTVVLALILLDMFLSNKRKSLQNKSL